MLGPHVSPSTPPFHTPALGSGVTVPMSPGSAGLGVAAGRVAAALAVVAAPREEAGWDGAGCGCGTGAVGGARLPGCQLGWAVAAQSSPSTTPSGVTPRIRGLSARCPPEPVWGSPGPGDPAGGVPAVWPSPGDGCRVGEGAAAELVAGVGCGDVGLPRGTPLGTTVELPGATEGHVWCRGMRRGSGGPSVLGGPDTPAVRARAPSWLGDGTPGVLAMAVGTGKPGPVPAAGWAVLAVGSLGCHIGPPWPPAPRDGGEGREAARGPCQAASVPCHGWDSAPRPPAASRSVPRELSNLCTPPPEGNVPVVPGPGLPVAAALLWCVPGLLSPSGAVAPRPSLAPGSGCKELGEPPWLCAGAVPVELCPGRALGVSQCSPAGLGTVTEDGECRRVPSGAVAPSTISSPTGSVRREGLVVGAVSSSVGAAEGPPPRPLPRLAGDGPWLPVAASAAPMARGGPAPVPAPCPPAGPVPSLLVQPPRSVLGGSAVPGGVPGKGSSSASVCSHVVAFGVGNCPAPAPCCGSVGEAGVGGC